MHGGGGFGGMRGGGGFGGMHAMGGAARFGGAGGVPHFAGARVGRMTFAHAGFSPRFAHAGFSRRAFFHHRFHRFAFVGVPFAFADYGYYDDCWRQIWTAYGPQWTNVCGGYGYY
jgi:hypothetical protein